ncbi:MAG: RloB family protein [Capsulimonadaceae bacterium]
MKAPRRGLVPRQFYVRDARLFVVATEGEKTEEQYLSIFECQRVHVEVLSTGPDGKSAAKHVLERLAQFSEQYDLRPDDELWLMVDMDRQRPQFIEEVTQMAAESGYLLAVSNPCFELWLLLHFRDHDEADVDCALIEARLRAHLSGYNKTKINVKLYSREAIERAIAAAKRLDRPENIRWPAYPGTHVYKLVETLIANMPLVSA